MARHSLRFFSIAGAAIIITPLFFFSFFFLVFVEQLQTAHRIVVRLLLPPSI